ncbi:hypothetical protein AKJ51_02995 [candidate division MSBL1 archaeon SCGC-AAA382A20]|uniref:HTH hxlR-type domain-containing protein n=1 Tax=candidate division MSBL1 archaeon SCGC-AAA382A20 TaxID=1698280 RepID=A0A133VJY5_9EURY|nr:hypothetical protein AKJ51_02995 [candidate division MSBL1 archaeon SCGC-AAA382A20]
MNFKTLAKKGAKEILYSLKEKEKMNFTELRDLTGSPTTTSKRLDELTELGLLERDVQNDKFRSVHYSLTEKGFKIVNLVEKIDEML